MSGERPTNSETDRHLDSAEQDWCLTLFGYQMQVAARSIIAFSLAEILLSTLLSLSPVGVFADSLRFRRRGQGHDSFTWVGCFRGVGSLMIFSVQQRPVLTGPQVPGMMVGNYVAPARMLDYTGNRATAIAMPTAIRMDRPRMS